MAGIKTDKYSVGILVVSDTVSTGEKEDRSGVHLEKIVQSEEFFCVSRISKCCTADEQSEIENVLKFWADDQNIDLILTVGGTGFSPRDVTPEATKAVIEKEAPHIANYMVMKCCEKTIFAVLSRSICGIRGRCLVLNFPGSTKGVEECFEVIAPVLPHALDQLKDNKNKVSSDHVKIQGSIDDRTCAKSQ